MNCPVCGEEVSLRRTYSGIEYHHIDSDGQMGERYDQDYLAVDEDILICDNDHEFWPHETKPGVYLTGEQITAASR